MYKLTLLKNEGDGLNKKKVVVKFRSAHSVPFIMSRYNFQSLLLPFGENQQLSDRNNGLSKTFLTDVVSWYGHSLWDQSPRTQSCANSGEKKLQLFKKEYNEHTGPFAFWTSNDGKLKTFFSYALFKMKKTNNKAEARPFDYRLQQLNRIKRGEIFFLQALRRQIKSRIS